jgi:hypothetical protein
MRDASVRYPESGSSTCCHGRTASGLRTTIGSPAVSARMQSGTMRSSAQSPPPTTLPARALATRTGESGPKNERLYAAVTSSAQPLEELYGS